MKEEIFKGALAILLGLVMYNLLPSFETVPFGEVIRLGLASLGTAFAWWVLLEID